MAVIIETSVGEMTIDLFLEERPMCCQNFLKLCKLKYFNFSLFHNVQRNFMAQTGDPTGTGRGGQSYLAKMFGDQARYFDWEVSPKIKHSKAGLISMVNNGNNMHGSQFFVTLGKDLNSLDGQHTVFGEVSEGAEVLAKINETMVDDDGRPYKDIRIFHTVVVDDPYDDPAGLRFPSRSPTPTRDMLKSDRIGVDEDVDDTAGKSKQEVEELEQQREASANAQLLEMVGDLPDVEVKPPDNVLFVCKLNPVTTDEDLEIIFSRFGNITSCEVIRDQKTDESLQYAFVEFEKEEDCANAYFKMDNVLIDDRRIHVDFSQSVAKVKWKGKGKGVEVAKESSSRPKYEVKDRSRGQGDYSLLFEGDEEEGGGRSGKKKNKAKKSKKKKHKKSRDSSSDASSDDLDSKDRSRVKRDKEGRGEGSRRDDGERNRDRAERGEGRDRDEKYRGRDRNRDDRARRYDPNDKKERGGYGDRDNRSERGGYEDRRGKESRRRDRSRS